MPQEERENRLQVVLDNISDGVISIDREAKITIINREACHALKCNPSEVADPSGTPWGILSARF